MRYLHTLDSREVAELVRENNPEPEESSQDTDVKNLS